MKWLIFVCGIILGIIGAVGTMAYLGQKQPVWQQPDQVMFPKKKFYDSGNAGLLLVVGTLTGPDIGYANNTNNIACYKNLNECVVTSIEQIGYNQIGQIWGPDFYQVIKWTASEIVAQYEPYDPTSTVCTNVTITIKRKRKRVFWVQEPINQTRPNCKDSDTSIYKWTIKDSPGWKTFSGKH